MLIGAVSLLAACGLIEMIDGGPRSRRLWTSAAHFAPAVGLAWLTDGRIAVATAYPLVIMTADSVSGPTHFDGWGFTDVSANAAETWVAGAAWHGIMVFDIETGETLLHYKGESRAVAWSPDGNWLAGATTAAQNGGCSCLFIWNEDLETHRSVTVPNDARVDDISWSPDSNRLVFSTRRGLHLYDVAANELLSFGEMPMEWRSSNVLWHPSLGLIAANTGAEIHFFDASSLEVQARVADGDTQYSSMQWLPDTEVLGVLDDQARLWFFTSEAVEYAPPRSLDRRVRDFRLSPDGRELLFAASDGAVGVVSLLTGTEIVRAFPAKAPTYAVGHHATSRRLATGGPDGVARVWSLASSTIQMIAEVDLGEGTIRSLSWSADGRRLVATAMPPAGRPSPRNGSGYHATGFLIDTSTWNVVATHGASGGTPLHAEMEFHPGGRILRSGDGTVQLLSGDDLSILGQAPGWVSGVASWNPDGTRFASGGSAASTFMVWDTESLAPVATYSTDLVRPTRFAWSSDGQKLLVLEYADARYRSTVELWDLAVGQLQLTMDFEGPVQDLRFSSDAHLILLTGARAPAAGTVLDVWDSKTMRLLATTRIDAVAYDVDWSMDEGIVFLALCDSTIGTSANSVEAFLASARDGN